MYADRLLESPVPESPKGAMVLHYYPRPVLVEDSEGRRIQLCMVPIIVGDSFQFHLQVMTKGLYVILYTTPVLINVVK